MRTARSLTAVALASVLALTACGGTDEPEPKQDAGEGFPVTVEDAGGKVTIDTAPKKIVSLSQSGTEMLFDIGAGKQVTAVDSLSTYPADAPTTDIEAFTPSVEAITEHDPDLVVLSDDMDGIVKQLDKVKVPVLHLPAAATLDDTYAQMRTLGEATGHADEAESKAKDIENRLGDIAAETKDELGDEKLSYYHELDSGMYSVTSKTFIGEVYGLFGMSNIADGTKDQAGGYPQLSAEYIVEQDPDLIVIGEKGKKAVADLEKRPAFDDITAVRNDNVVTVDPDISSRWGPRVVDFAEAVSDAAVAAAADEKK